MERGVEEMNGSINIGLGTPEPDTKCQIVTQTQLDRIENQNQMIIDRLDQLLEQKKPKARKMLTGDPYFDHFWRRYPLKKGKKAAQKAWNNIEWSKQRAGMCDFIIRDVVTRIEEDRQWIAGYIPHASTYLNGARWEDEITPVGTQAETLPKEDSDLVAWAGSKGWRAPRPG